MQQLDYDEFSARLDKIYENDIDPSLFDIIPVKDGGNRQHSFWYLPTVSTNNDLQDDVANTPIDMSPSHSPDGTCQKNIVSAIVSCSLRRLKYNEKRNG